MCTGDNIDTATAISLNAGIITEEERKGKFACMTGKEFREHVGGIVTEKYNVGKPDEYEVKKVKDIKKFR